MKKSSHGYSPLATPKPKPNDRLLKRKLPSLTLPDGTNPYKTELTVSMRQLRHGQTIKMDLAHPKGLAITVRQSEINVNVNTCIVVFL